MRRRTMLVLLVLALLSSIVMAQTSTSLTNLGAGFQALLFHAARLDESYPEAFRRYTPIAMAIDAFGKAVKEEDQAGEASLMLGLIYTYLERPGTALDYYLRFAELNPEDAWVHALIGDRYAEMGRLNEAEQSYRLALAGAPDEGSWARAHYGLGAVALERGQYSQAKESFELALEQAEDFFDARLGLGQALYHLGEYEQAIEVLEVAHLQWPRSLTMLQYLGWSYEAAGLSDQAAHAFDRLAELGGGN